MKKFLVAIPFVAAAFPAQATPAYLSCSYNRGDGVVVSLSIVADENSQILTVTNEKNGNTKQYTAVFSPSDVRWVEVMGSGSAKTQNQINRTDLSFRTKTLSFDGSVIADQGGSCQVQQAPNRAF